MCPDRSENFLLLHDVLCQIGMKREKFLSSYGDEVVVHEIGQKIYDHRFSAVVDENTAMTKKSAAGSTTRVEFVCMSDMIRRLLNIDMSLVSTLSRGSITDAPHR